MADILKEVEEGLRRKRELEDEVDRLQQLVANGQIVQRRLESQLEDVREKCRILERGNDRNTFGPLEEAGLWAAGPSLTIELTNKLSGTRRVRVFCHGKSPVRLKTVDPDEPVLAKTLKEFIRRAGQSRSIAA